MKPHALLPLLLVIVLTGCDSTDEDDVSALVSGNSTGGVPADPGAGSLPEAAPGPVAPAEPEDYEQSISHPYLPMDPGTVWIYEGDHDGLPRRDEARILEEPRVIHGIPCATLLQEVYIDGKIAEVTRHWYAQDVDGNLWTYGEHSVEFGGGQAVTTTDSWQAGVDGAEPWMVLGADPQVGDRYYGEYPGGRDEVLVLSLNETAVVPAGTFENCLSALETNLDDPEDADRVIYSPGLGLVSEKSSTGKIELTEIRKE